jgi:plasmid stabilization system protein ParE
MNEPIFLSNAETDIIKLIEFFDTREPGAGLEFWEDTYNTCLKAAKRPKTYRLLYQGKIRRIFTEKFPVSILFEDQNGQILVHRVSYATSDYQSSVL